MTYFNYLILYHHYVILDFYIFLGYFKAGQGAVVAKSLLKYSSTVFALNVPLGQIKGPVYQI